MSDEADTVDTQELGRLVRAARALRGWRQVDLAKAACVERALVSRVETGHRVTRRSRQRLARALGVDLDPKKTTEQKQ